MIAVNMKRARAGVLRFGFCGLLLLSMTTIPYVLQQQQQQHGTVVRPSAVQHPPRAEEQRKVIIAGTVFHGNGSASQQNEDSEKIADFVKTVLGYEEWPDQCRSQPGFSQPKTVPEFDLMKEGPFRFLSDYRNPCWRLHQSQELRCLPYFYMAGFPKCGTTDMYGRLIQHPHMIRARKEPQWIARTRFNGRPLDLYTRDIAEAVTKSNDPLAIVGDFSVSTAWHNENWALLPGNELCTEPRVINADYIRHLIPEVKIIVMLRDPATRLYSDFMFFKEHNKSQEIFHHLVEKNIDLFRSCERTKGLRYCAYGYSQYSVRLQVGLYSVFIEDWFLRFPRDQMLFVRTEDVHDGTAIMPTIFKFLNLPQPNKATMQKIVTHHRLNVGKQSREHGPMWNKTRAALDAFYRPFNARLAHILQDQRFAWQDAHH